MSILCKISGIPVFYNIEDAKRWGRQYGLNSTHTHRYDGRTGFMAGSNHTHVTGIVNGTIKVSNEEALLENWANNRAPQVTQSLQQTFEIDMESDDDIDSAPVPSGGGGY